MPFLRRTSRKGLDIILKKYLAKQLAGLIGAVDNGSLIRFLG